MVFPNVSFLLASQPKMLASGGRERGYNPHFTVTYITNLLLEEITLQNQKVSQFLNQMLS